MLTHVLVVCQKIANLSDFEFYWKNIVKLYQNFHPIGLFKEEIEAVRLKLDEQTYKIVKKWIKSV